MMELLVEQRRRILHIALNRPHKRNALSAAMCLGIVDAISNAQNDRSIGVILMSATGSVFCSGIDLDEAVTMEHQELASIHNRLFSMGAKSRKPIVVAVNGACLGGGLGLVSQGHIVVSSTGAAFGLPEMKLGLWPFIIYRSVEAALGHRRTLELSLTGRLFYSQDALQWGLVHSVCPPVEVCDRAWGFAADLEKSSPDTIEAGLDFVSANREKSEAEMAELAMKGRCDCLNSADFKEGFLAFKQKRKAYWPSMPGKFYERTELVTALKE